VKRKHVKPHLEVLRAGLLLAVLASCTAASQSQTKTKDAAGISAPSTSAADTVARVTLDDGSSVEVSNVQFVYEWYYVDDWENYRNPTVYKKRASEFYFQETAKGISVDRASAPADLARIKAEWGKSERPSLYTNFAFLITRRDGTEVQVSFPRYSRSKSPGFPSKYLQDLPDEKIKEPSVVGAVRLEGTAYLNGVRGRFSGTLYYYPHSWGSDSKMPCPLVTEIVFTH
jgi:hypothetical protein